MPQPLPCVRPARKPHAPRPTKPASDAMAGPVREFLAYLRVEAGLAAATLEAYSRDVRDLLDHLARAGCTSFDNVAPNDLADHLRDLHRTHKLQPSSIARHLATLRVLFRFLGANGHVSEDPARLLERPTRWKRLPGVLLLKQMKQLLEAPKPEHGRLWLRDKAMLELMYAAGLRASEV